MGRKFLSRVLMMPCKVFLRDHFRTARIIARIGSGRDRVGGLGGAL